MLMMMKDHQLILSYIMAVFTLQQSIPMTIAVYGINERARDKVMEDLHNIFPTSMYRVFPELKRNAFVLGNHKVVPVTLDEAHQSINKQNLIVVTDSMNEQQIRQFTNWVK